MNILKRQLISLARRLTPDQNRNISGRAYYQDKFLNYYSNGLTPEKLTGYLKKADRGDVYSQYRLFDEMEEKDTHLYSELQKRKMAVTKWPWRIVPSDDTDSRAIEIAEGVEKILRGIADFEDDVLDVLDAIGKGASFTELNWQASEGQVWVEDLENIPMYNFVYDTDKRIWKVLTRENPVTGEEIPEHKLIYHRLRAKTGQPVSGGLTRICAWMYIFKNYSIKDWAIFMELYGIPFRLGKYTGDPSAEEMDILKQAVIGLGSDGAGIISKNTEIEIVQASRTAGTNVHELMAMFCNREMSKAILGTVDSGDRGTGTYAEGLANLEVREDLHFADIRSLCSTLRRDLIRPLVLFNYGDNEVRDRLPNFEIVVSEPVDLLAEASKDSIVINQIGLPASKKWLREKYDIPEPEDDSDVIEGGGGYMVANTQSPVSPNEMRLLKKKVRGGSVSRPTLKMRPE